MPLDTSWSLQKIPNFDISQSVNVLPPECRLNSTVGLQFTASARSHGRVAFGHLGGPPLRVLK